MLRPGAVRLCSGVGFPLVLPTAPILPLLILGCSSCPFLISCFAASPRDELYLTTEPGKAGAKPLHSPIGTARGRIRARSECLGLCLNPLNPPKAFYVHLITSVPAPHCSLLFSFLPREIKLRNYDPEDEELKKRKVPPAKPASGEQTPGAGGEGGPKQKQKQRWCCCQIRQSPCRGFINCWDEADSTLTAHFILSCCQAAFGGNEAALNGQKKPAQGSASSQRWRPGRQECCCCALFILF